MALIVEMMNLIVRRKSLSGIKWIGFDVKEIANGMMIFSCLLYTSDAADDSLRVDLGGRRII